MFKFQVASFLAWKIWEEQPTAILLRSSKRRVIDLFGRSERIAWSVTDASFSKWPREPISKVSRSAEKPKVSRSFTRVM